MKKLVKNRASSVRAKLATLAKKLAVDFDLILLRYLQERFIAWLSSTEHAGSLILKGGVPFSQHISRKRSPSGSGEKC
ncbi:MAG: Abortive infection protein AbiEii [Candidatus Eremiobacteraeota bacterium]|nr:Abortive infection protein AbiEii [Candidatus Eremiobacteraeota bacterium]